MAIRLDWDTVWSVFELHTCYYVHIRISIIGNHWRQHPTKHQRYGHLPPITKSIQARRTRLAGHCWRSKDELIIDVLLWTPTYGQAKAGQPARTYIQQLCEDTGCSPEELPEAMNDREKWRERVRDIRASSTTWWWKWWPLLLWLWHWITYEDWYVIKDTKPKPTLLRVLKDDNDIK